MSKRFKMDEENDAFEVVDDLIDATTAPDEHVVDPIWERGEKLLLEACMLYLWHTSGEEEHTYENVLKLLDGADYGDKDSSPKTVLDVKMDELGKEDPGNLAVKLYRDFRIAAGNLAMSFAVSARHRVKEYIGKEE